MSLSTFNCGVAFELKFLYGKYALHKMNGVVFFNLFFSFAFLLGEAKWEGRGVYRIGRGA